VPCRFHSKPTDERELESFCRELRIHDTEHVPGKPFLMVQEPRTLIRFSGVSASTTAVPAEVTMAGTQLGQSLPSGVTARTHDLMVNN
jgi:hypothetical protein